MVPEVEQNEPVTAGREAAQAATDDRPTATVYEIGYLIAPTVSEEGVPREVTAIKDCLEKWEAVFIAEGFPRFKPLAYPMRKRVSGAYQTFTNAYVGWIKFEALPAAAKDIESALKQDVNLIRFLFFKTVREDTMTVRQKPPRAEFRREYRELPKGVPPSAPVSEAELEKSLEKIISE